MLLANRGMVRKNGCKIDAEGERERERERDVGILIPSYLFFFVSFFFFLNHPFLPKAPQWLGRLLQTALHGSGAMV